MNTFDVIVLGGGPGGYVAALRTAQSGLKTAIIEKEAIGGTCLNWGCIPTKCLLHNAKVIDTLSKGKSFGFSFDNLEIDYAAAHKRSRKVVKRQTKAVESLIKKNNITVIKGSGCLETTNSIKITETDEIIQGENIIIATGSGSRQIPGISVDGERVLSFRHALELTQIPDSAVIIGAGPIGMEFATIWNLYGSKVSVLEMAPDVLPQEDEEICAEAVKQYKKNGIRITTQAKVKSIETEAEKTVVTFGHQNKTHTVEAEKILLAVGFVPNIVGIGLSSLGINTGNGSIDIDENMRTNIPNIYAVGDVTGKMGLAHVASYQGMVAADSIIGKNASPIEYSQIPRCTYSAPETASVGLTERQLKAQKIGYKSAKYNFLSNGKALALDQNRGFVKILTKDDSNEILGVHMIGSNVTELISEPAAAIRLGKNADMITDTVHPHPSLSEVLYEAANLMIGKGIHA